MTDLPTFEPEYRPVAGHPGYRVGSDGSVWSEWRMRGGGYGRTPTRYRSGTWRRLKPDYNRGRPRVRLRVAEGQYRHRMVHHLVLEAFAGPCPEGCEACHNDGDTTNNHICNLRWDDHTANIHDKRRHGTQPNGEVVNFAKLTDSDVIEIRRRHAAGEGKCQLGEAFGCTPENIHHLVAGHTWQHLLGRGAA